MTIDGWNGETEVVKLQIDGRTVTRLCPRVVREIDDGDCTSSFTDSRLIYIACLDKTMWIDGIWSHEWGRTSDGAYVLYDVYLDRVEDPVEYDAMLPLLRSGAFLAPEASE